MTGHSAAARPGHDEFRLLAAAAVDGRLDADSASALEDHLAGCAECRADQRAMLDDHVWLATPRRLDPPSPQVREFVLEAARSHRVPRTSNADRPWGAFAVAALVVAIIGGGVILAVGYDPALPGSIPSRTPGPIASSRASISPFVAAAVASGHFVPDNDVAAGSLDVEIQAIGSVESGGSASVAVTGPFGESWTGRVTQSTYWIDESGPGRVYVAWLAGCKTGTACEAFTLMLVDGREGDGTYKIELDFYDSLADIALERPHPWYRLTSGKLSVTGPLQMGATCVPRPPGVTSHWRLDGDGLTDVGDAAVTLRGEASFGQGLIQDGQALRPGQGWGEVADDPQIRVRRGDFTVLLWVSFDDLTGEQTLIEQWREGPTTEDARGWTLTKLATNEILITTGGSTGGGSAQSGVLEIRPGWHLVAARRVGDAVALFFDGEVVAEGAMTLPDVDLRVDTPLLLGRRGDDRAYFVRGAIDDVMLAVGTGLSEDEIAGIYQATWAGTC